MLKRNELLNHNKTWKDLKNISQSERNHFYSPVKVTYCMSPTIWHCGKGKTKGRVKIGVWGEEGMNRHSTEDFQC